MSELCIDARGVTKGDTRFFFLAQIGYQQVMAVTKCHIQILFLVLSMGIAWSEDDNSTVNLNSTSEDEQVHIENTDKTFSSPASENVPDPIGMPRPTGSKSHHHSKQRDHLENVQSHRSPVYETVSQPCTSFGCRGYAPPSGGYQPWQQRGNRFVPYPQPIYEPRRRGQYPPQDFYPDGYYGPRDPDYSYDPRGVPGYPQMQGRYGGYGGYSQPIFGNRFLG